MPLDPKVQALLARVNAQPAPPLHALSVAEHRAQTVAQAKGGGPLPSVAAISERTIPGPAGDVPITVYRPPGE